MTEGGGEGKQPFLPDQRPWLNFDPLSPKREKTGKIGQSFTDIKWKLGDAKKHSLLNEASK